MSRLIALSSIVAAGLMTTMTPAPAGALTYDKLATMTFNGPVQIPGVMLNAGTYRFRLANPDTSRNVLQVLSDDGSTVYAMFHTTPDWRMNVTEDPVMTFKETPAGVPPAVNSLFYGGERNGYAFVYPSGWPIMTAALAPQPEITYAPITAAVTPEAVAEPEPVLAPAAEPVAELAAESVAEPVAELPRTASPVPLVALGGFTSLVLGLVGLLRRHLN